MKSNFLLLGVVLALLSCCRLARAQDEPGEAPVVPGAELGLKHRQQFGPYPKPDAGYVTDLADLLNRDEEEQIERWLWQVEAKTGVEIAVVTIGSISSYPGSANDSIEAFATALFDTYGIGNLPNNNGVLLLVAKNDRKVRIELGKYYGHARDGDAARIVDNVIVPEFREQRYAMGVTEGVQAIMKEFAGVRVGTNWPLIFMVAAIPIVGLIAFSLLKNGKRGWGWVFVGVLIILVLAVLRAVFAVLENLPEGSSDSWGAGGYGGGFGGGSSGGGGATGSW